MKRKDLDMLVEATCSPTTDDIRPLIAEMLSQQLADGCVSRCICSNCGLYGDIEKEHAKKLLSMTTLENNQEKIDLKKVYFVTSCCEVCKTEEINHLNIEVKEY